ncbi:hypothetical protein C8R42DRAFT_644439 [Lentinula raphanica]|nr:hypothetical protein C8R42DRAFT_644439 [Lentinula raphanica]
MGLWTLFSSSFTCLVLSMPALRFALLTRFEQSDTTTHVVYPSLLDPSTISRTPNFHRTPDRAVLCGIIDRNSVASPELRQKEPLVRDDPTIQGTVGHDFALLHQGSVARAEGESQLHPGDAMAPASPVLDVVPHVLEQKEERQRDNGFMNRHNVVDSPRRIAVVESESVLQPHDDESISWAIRTRRQVLRQNPYPTRSKHSSQSSPTSRNQKSVSTVISSENGTPLYSYGRGSTSADVSFENQTPSPSSLIDTRIVQATLFTQSAFGYTPFDYHQRKVLYKNAYTSWYSYSTPGPIDNPPELPQNAVGLQHNVIFMHINEVQRTQYPHGPLSKLLKHCVRMWIWDGNSSKWDRISVGERRTVEGYQLSLSLRYKSTIHPQWVVPKSARRLIAENS